MYSTYYKTTKKKTVAKLKVTRKLEEYLPAFSISSHTLLVLLKIYQPFFKYIGDSSTYISDFFIISAIRHRISTYRHFSASHSSSIPVTTIKEATLTATSFHIPHPVLTGIYQRFFKYINDFSTYISDFSLYRRFDTEYRFTDILRH